MRKTLFTLHVIKEEGEDEEDEERQGRLHYLEVITCAMKLAASSRLSSTHHIRGNGLRPGRSHSESIAGFTRAPWPLPPFRFNVPGTATYRAFVRNQQFLTE